MKFTLLNRNCGEMASDNPQYAVGPVCKEGAKIVYAWAMDAPKLTLPKGINIYLQRKH